MESETHRFWMPLDACHEDSSLLDTGLSRIMKTIAKKGRSCCLDARNRAVPTRDVSAGEASVLTFGDLRRLHSFTRGTLHTVDGRNPAPPHH